MQRPACRRAEVWAGDVPQVVHGPVIARILDEPLKHRDWALVHSVYSTGGRAAHRHNPVPLARTSEVPEAHYGGRSPPDNSVLAIGR
jgi:hypothetical protein